MASVLIIVENLPVPLDRRVWQEACALRDAGHDVSVICPQMRGYTQAEEILDGIQIYRHWIAEEASGIVGFVKEYASALWGETKLAWKAWRRKKFDVIHLCNPPDLLFLVALPFKLMFGTRIIFDVHDLWPEMFEAKFGRRGLLYWAVRLAERCTLASADVVLATNQSVLSAAQERGRKKPDAVFEVRTSPSVIDTSLPPDPKLKKGRKFLAAYIGVMGNADGVHYLMEAADHIVRELGRTDIQFLLMGSGPEHAQLVALRDRLGLQDYVDMPGRVSNEFLFQALQTMDAGVACDPINPYNDHCTMNKTLEYMAFGKPQVLFGTREGRVSAGEAAVYVDENSSAKLGEALCSLLDDPEKCSRLGAIGKARLHDELSWKRSVANLTAAYQQALRPKS